MAIGTVYLKIRPNLNPNGNKVVSLTVLGMTQNPPADFEGASRIVKLLIEIPDEQLLPLEVKAMPDQIRMSADYEETLKNLGKAP